MKKQIGLGLIALAMLSIGMTGCTDKAPSCKDQKVQDRVIELAKAGIASKNGQRLVDNLTFSIEDIKIDKENDNGSFQCSATIKGTNNEAYNTLKLKYTTTLDESKKLGYRVDVISVGD